MKVKTLLLLIVLPIILGSCANQFMISSLEPQKINEVTIIDPAVSISLIHKGKGNRSTFDKTLTQIAHANIEEGINTYLSQHCKVNSLTLDSATNELVDFQLYQMFGMIQAKKDITQIPIPPSIDSIMNVNNIDYAVCALHVGFSREKGNYGAQVAKGVLIGILTLGTFYTVPIKAASELTICIIDSQNKNIAFHNRSYFQDQEPIDKNITNKQLQKLFDKYYSVN